MASISKEDDHIQVIRDYQQRLLMQNRYFSVEIKVKSDSAHEKCLSSLLIMNSYISLRMHKESIDEARKRLLEYQNKLKQRYASVSAALFGPAPAGIARLNSVPAPSLLQGSEASPAAGETTHLPSKSAPVQDFVQPVEYSELPQRLQEPSEKDTEQRVDASKPWGYIQTMDVPVQQPPESSQISGSCEEAEKANLVGTPATQALGFHGLPGLIMHKAQDTSTKAQPVPPVRQVQFTLPTDTSSGSSETLHPYKSETGTAPAEKTQLPTSLKHMPVENRTTFEQTLHPPVQPFLSSAASEPGRLQELKNRSGPFSSFSDIVELRNQMLASSRNIQAQQEYLKELQEQLDKQREALLARQRAQEDSLLHRHAELKTQMEQQQEALKVFLQQVCFLSVW